MKISTHMPLQYGILIFVLSAFLFDRLSLNADDAVAAQYEAEIRRNLAGSVIGKNGFSMGQVNLEKGRVYDVVGYAGFSDVLISVNGATVKIRDEDVSISQKIVRKTDQSGLVPGRLFLISAYYGPPVDRPRPDRKILRALGKILPNSEITKPIEILVTDALLGRTADSQSIKGKVDYDGNIRIEKQKKNVLIVEYEFNGEKNKKSAVEETVLTIP
jgi:hypothetical protein